MLAAVARRARAAGSASSPAGSFGLGAGKLLDGGQRGRRIGELVVAAVGDGVLELVGNSDHPGTIMVVLSNGVHLAASDA